MLGSPIDIALAMMLGILLCKVYHLLVDEPLGSVHTD